MKNIIILTLMLLGADSYAQDLVKIWEGRAGEQFNFGKIEFTTFSKGSTSLSDYNDDGVADIVLSQRGSNRIYIIDGLTRTPLDSLEIENSATVCNGAQVERFHVSFVHMDPTATGNKTALISRSINGRLLGTRSDTRVVMSGGTTMLTYPCDRQLHALLDPEGNGYLIITMTNLMTNTAEAWSLP